MKNVLIGFVTAMLSFCALNSRAQVVEPSDHKATKETRNLYNNMQQLVSSGVMFGHHDDTAYGVNWRLQPDSSDVKAVTGSYPAVYGWDLAKLEHDSTTDINGIPFEAQRKLVIEAYQRGGINTFCWHMDNPVNDKTAWDTTSNSVKQLLPGGEFHDKYEDYLKKMAAYIKTLKGEDGKDIPILFRPFHELTGGWFWWGNKTTDPQDFVALWQFTIDFLRKKQKLHNLLVVYSTADFISTREFMDRYPGDDYVDFVGFDIYCNGNAWYVQQLDEQLSMLQQVAAEHHKVACIPETGYEGIPDANWWTNILLPQLAKYKLSYVMAWRNATNKHFFAPYPGQKSAADFVKFYSSPNVIFQNNLTPLNIYGKGSK
ncbi:glycoside hydrolase family 26 protein [Mucilaginibacter agri]|uniref:Mannan endo-1,4-beta-mannosidase n=1 Tax=Mucilaginibacter agri TaxID=2695265 RepID=A0A966DUZ2_9SPHI|nr:glycosyl hydrolase [Mucilaginibacter agri]NCD70942.1 beta-mannosidase [Mucilaginibacter agri]